MRATAYSALARMMLKLNATMNEDNQDTCTARLEGEEEEVEEEVENEGEDEEGEAGEEQGVSSEEDFFDDLEGLDLSDRRVQLTPPDSGVEQSPLPQSRPSADQDMCPSGVSSVDVDSGQESQPLDGQCSDSEDGPKGKSNTFEKSLGKGKSDENVERCCMLASWCKIRGLQTYSFVLIYVKRFVSMSVCVWAEMFRGNNLPPLVYAENN